MDKVKFSVNGVEYTVGSEVTSETTLLDYIRSVLQLHGTKYMCREGGCGVCIVAVRQRCGTKVTAVNSCLVSVTSCHNWCITTVEGLGNRLTGYHPLQETLAKCNGSQCGYCSCGWVMAAYSLLQGNPKITKLEMEESLGSNICRCTGYRPILDALKKFAADEPNRIPLTDIEDLGSEGSVCTKPCKESEWCVISKEDLEDPVIHIQLKDGSDWYRPQSLYSLLQIVNDVRDQYMLIAGNTAKGVYPIDKYPPVLIDISNVKELKEFKLDQNLVLGAGVTLSEALDIFEYYADAKEEFGYLDKMSKHLKMVAHVAVRNIGTFGGNLMIKHAHREFPSDIFILIETVGAQVEIVTLAQPKRCAKNAASGSKTLTMAEFLKEDMDGKIITNILFPPLSVKHKLITYKIMPRAQHVTAIVNAGFMYKLNADNVVEECRIVFSGLSPTFYRAAGTEEFLREKQLFTNQTLQSSITVLNNELVVTRNPQQLSIEYRKQLAIGLFYKSLLTLCPSDILKACYRSGSINLRETRPVSGGSQEYDTDPAVWPLNQPITKVDALLQCSGEAVYTEDVPPLKDEVFVSFAVSQVAVGNIESIDPSQALKQPGVLAFYSSKDIPGSNSFTPGKRIYLVGEEEIICSDAVSYFNQPIGIVVANDRRVADRAANLVTARYTNVRRPVIDVKEAKNDPARVTLFSKHLPTYTNSDIYIVIAGTHAFYHQIHFCTELFSCVSVPSETGLRIRATTQGLELLQAATSNALLIDQNKIDVYVRRLGGGFGSKITRPTQGAIACSLAALKLNRPCRFIQSQSATSRINGKRFPCAFDYNLGVNKHGVIQYLVKSYYSDNGYVVNDIIISVGETVYSNCYDKSTWTYESYNVVTDTASNTWCRSPATLENIANTEMLMDQISYELDMDPIEVRFRNLGEEFRHDVEEMWRNIEMNSNFYLKRIQAEKFNVENRWKKRGVRAAFMKWSSEGKQSIDVNVSLYYGDGSVVITHGGVDMGQGINTKAAQICAHFLGIPVERIQVKPTSTITGANSTETAASSTGHNVGIGIRRCCLELQSRLDPIRRRMNNPTWQQLLTEAFAAGVNLQAHSSSSYNDSILYDIYGIAVAEVELDILTGEHALISVVILEDVGRSVNPFIDIGQIEGAFVMGLGYWTSETVGMDPVSGEVLTDRPSNYWVPLARDIPQDFKIYFRKCSNGPEMLLGSKATGEPATCLAVCVPLAMREAITAARTESGIPSTKWYDIDGPFTVERICLAAATKVEDFKFY